MKKVFVMQIRSSLASIRPCDTFCVNSPVKNKAKGAAIAQWIHLRLPFCRPGFESQASHLSFYFIYSQICTIFFIVL